MSRTKKAAIKAKLARKAMHAVAGGASTSRAPGENSGKTGKTGKAARKAAAKAKAAANGPKNTGVATKLETLEGQTLPIKTVPKNRAEGSVDGVVSEQLVTPAAPVAQPE